MGELNRLLNHFPKTYYAFAETVASIEIFPWFICIHVWLVALSMRNRVGALEHTKNHPFASWFVCVTSCFGGSLIMYFLLGQPIVQIYGNTNNILLASLAWYLVFFSPFDIVDRISQIHIVKASLLILKEVHRIRQIRIGVEIASSLYARNFFIIVLIGAVKGSGAKFLLRLMDSFIRGNMSDDNEFLRPTFSTKNAVLSSVLLYMQQYGYLDIDQFILISYIVIITAVIQVAIVCFGLNDPYKRIEDWTCYVFVTMSQQDVQHGKKKVE